MMFTNAVRRVFANPAQTLRIMALPLIVNVAALCAGAAQVFLLWVPTDLLTLMLEDSEGYLPPAYDYVDAVLAGVFYCILPLFGAAILTEIYRKVGPQAFDTA